MDKVMFSIGPVNIYWYSFLILMAVFIGGSIIVNYSKRVNLSKVLMIDMIFYAVLSAVVGARVYYVIFNFDMYRDNILDIFKIWEGGLAIYGGIIGGILFIAYYCHKKKLPFVRVLDVCSLSLLLGQAIGRWGNFFNGEAYGPICNRSFLEGLHIPKFIIDGMNINGAYYQPTFLYESIWCIIGVLILLFIRKNSTTVGRQTCFYLIWYGVGRYFIEGIRSDSLYFESYKISQIVSIIFILVGVIGIIVTYFKNHKVDKNVIDNSGRI